MGTVCSNMSKIQPIDPSINVSPDNENQISRQNSEANNQEESREIKDILNEPSVGHLDSVPKNNSDFPKPIVSENLVFDERGFVISSIKVSDLFDLYRNDTDSRESSSSDSRESSSSDSRESSSSDSRESSNSDSSLNLSPPKLFVSENSGSNDGAPDGDIHTRIAALELNARLDALTPEKSERPGADKARDISYLRERQTVIKSKSEERDTIKKLEEQIEKINMIAYYIIDVVKQLKIIKMNTINSEAYKNIPNNNQLVLNESDTGIKLLDDYIKKRFELEYDEYKPLKKDYDEFCDELVKLYNSEDATGYVDKYGDRKQYNNNRKNMKQLLVDIREILPRWELLNEKVYKTDRENDSHESGFSELIGKKFDLLSKSITEIQSVMDKPPVDGADRLQRLPTSFQPRRKLDQLAF